METKIFAKLEELAKQREQLLAQLNATIGAEQALRSLLENKSACNKEGNATNENSN